ncbi:MAG TPA: iron ABC transporter permease [Veillonellaceae bacterium]|nr:iron ABC transporter permease [Veillonellaceae bacterium]
MTGLMERRSAALLLILFLALAGLSLLALGIGSAWFSPKEIVEGLWNGDSTIHLVVLNLRLPRILIAILTGAALSISGALLQAVMRNPLADPGIIGVSAGAVTAATTVMLLVPGLLLLLPLFAFGGALLACVIIYILAWKEGVDPVRIVLAGVAVNAVLGSYTSFLQLLNSDNLAGVLGFLNGSLSGRGWDQLWLVAGYAGIGLFLAFLCIKGANILQLGDEMALSLGVNVNAWRIIISAVAAFLAAATVAVAGMIGFVGLVVPHMARMMAGADYRSLIPVSALLGSLILLAADTAGRVLIPGMEIPVGLVMAMTGGPFFLYMLRKKGYV